MKKRILYHNAYVHVVNRGNRKQLLFVDDYDRERFLLRLQSITEETRDRVVAYCLMPNHYHLMFRIYSANSLRKTMLRLGTAYAKYFANKYYTVGHVFQGRYRSVTAKGLAHRLVMMRYIHRNPLGIRSLGYNFRDYPWSSHEAYMNGGNDPYINIKTHGVLRLFPSLREYEQFVISSDNDAKAYLKGWTPTRSLLY